MATGHGAGLEEFEKEIGANVIDAAQKVGNSS